MRWSQAHSARIAKFRRGPVIRVSTIYAKPSSSVLASVSTISREILGPYISHEEMKSAVGSPVVAVDSVLVGNTTNGEPGWSLSSLCKGCRSRTHNIRPALPHSVSVNCLKIRCALLRKDSGSPGSRASIFTKCHWCRDACFAGGLYARDPHCMEEGKGRATLLR